MIASDTAEKIRYIAGAENVLVDEAMALHTSFRIGGPADLFVTPTDMQALCKSIALCREQQIPWNLVGNGTNLLVGDQGVRGVVIQTRKLQDITTEGETITASAGCLLSTIAREALNSALAGMEFASGIPGTLGGAVVMNAGAYGGEMKDIIESVQVLDEDGRVTTLTNEQMDFAYRSSLASEKNLIILSAVIRLTPGNKEEILAKMNDFNGRRRDKQPLDKPSAGSTFKRPEGYFAGKLIMDAGLRGYCVGGAAVSEKHCGFVVNEGGASAADVCALIAHVQRVVREAYAVELETEVKKLGDF